MSNNNKLDSLEQQKNELSKDILMQDSEKKAKLYSLYNSIVYKETLDDIENKIIFLFQS